MFGEESDDKAVASLQTIIGDDWSDTLPSLNNGTDESVLSVTRLKIIIISTEIVLFHFNNLNRFQADFYSCLSKIALTTH